MYLYDMGVTMRGGVGDMSPSRTSKGDISTEIVIFKCSFLDVKQILQGIHNFSKC